MKEKSRRWVLVGVPGYGIVRLARRTVLAIALAAIGSSALSMLLLERIVRSRLILGGELSDAALMVLPHLAFIAGVLGALAWIAYAVLCYRIIGPLVRLKATIRARTEGKRAYLRLRGGDYFSGTAELLNREWVAADSVKKAARELGSAATEWLTEGADISDKGVDRFKKDLKKLLTLLGEREAIEALDRPERKKRAPSSRSDTVVSEPPRPPPLTTLADLEAHMGLPRRMSTEARRARPRSNSFMAAQRWLENLDEVIFALFRLRSSQSEPTRVRSKEMS
jgi:hypothetical protein